VFDASNLKAAFLNASEKQVLLLDSCWQCIPEAASKITIVKSILHQLFLNGYEGI
jgi:hypothetical protein